MERDRGFRVTLGVGLLGAGAGIAAIIWQTEHGDQVPFRRLWFFPAFDVAVAVAVFGVVILLSLIFRTTPTRLKPGESRRATSAHTTPSGTATTWEETKAGQDFDVLAETVPARTEVPVPHASVPEVSHRELAIEGGDGPDFDWPVPIMEVYRRLDNLKARESIAYVVENGLMKVLRITNSSETAIEKVRVDVSVLNGATPHLTNALLWVHNDLETADIGPHSSHHVVLGMKSKLGISLDGGGEREYERPIGYVREEFMGAILLVRAWAPGDVVAASRRFRLERPFPASYQSLSLWLPKVTDE